jgi:hypothetical protein
MKAVTNQVCKEVQEEIGRKCWMRCAAGRSDASLPTTSQYARPPFNAAVVSDSPGGTYRPEQSTVTLPLCVSWNNVRSCGESSLSNYTPYPAAPTHSHRHRLTDHVWHAGLYAIQVTVAKPSCTQIPHKMCREMGAACSLRGLQIIWRQ